MFPFIRKTKNHFYQFFLFLLQSSRKAEWVNHWLQCGGGSSYCCTAEEHWGVIKSGGKGEGRANQVLNGAASWYYLGRGNTSHRGKYWEGVNWKAQHSVSDRFLRRGTNCLLCWFCLVSQHPILFILFSFFCSSTVIILIIQTWTLWRQSL